MKQIILLIITLIIISCGNKKIVQLPEIENAQITDIQDVSAAYLFYSETQPDSVELNRKNLISTTNWLVNIDKRLTLKQVIPHIKFLQEKKQNAGHQNPNAKNYFTCHDLSRNNLGFIEFTDVVYETEILENFFLKRSKNVVNIHILSLEKIQITCYCDTLLFKSSNIKNLKNEIKSLLGDQKVSSDIILSFNSIVSFQDYIKVKSILSRLDLPNVSVSNKEFILN